MAQKMDAATTRSETEDSFFELDEYNSDTEAGNTTSDPGSRVDDLSASTMALLERFRGHIAGHQNSEDETDDQIKIFYCSRTHSQLSQFAHELRRVSFPSSLPQQQDISEVRSDPTENNGLDEVVKHVSLGSRKQLCINPRVSSLGNATAINERCMDLQQPGVAADKKCPYLPSKEDKAVQLDFRDRTLATVQDIEDIGQVGKHLGVCPYYATRPVVKHSEVSTTIPSQHRESLLGFQPQ
jgi:chromosome transmission fidelity protein 1